MNLVFDCESSGLPRENPDNKWLYSDPKKLENYDSCRLISISWILARGAEVVEQTYYLIKPKNFLISPESQKIHGITQEKAENEGIDISEALHSFNQALQQSDNLIAHNVYFDINVIKSEFYRTNSDDKARFMDQKHHVCTMKLGKEFMNFHKNPKLSELYQYCYQIKATNLHNALADTFYCWKCFLLMVPQEPHVYFINNKKINLSEPQKKIVHSDLNKNILVVASAGSGKTLTIAVRIKHLIDSGVDPGEIMLTTFTRDASYDMKKRLLNVLGYESNVKIGTIDSICREFCTNLKLKNVSQFCVEYLEWILGNPDYLKRWRYLFIDEYQDINTDQFNIIDQFYLAGVNIFAVGDDCQNIYTFRGSKLEYFLNFTTQFHNSIQFQLTHNYRSNPQIINFANQIIKSIDQIPKTMMSVQPHENRANKPPEIYCFNNSSEQCTKILEKIAKDYSSPKNEIAILAPQNYHLYPIEETLAKHGINSVLLDKNQSRYQTHKPDTVCLATIHKAKGLEWNHVFIVGCQDEIFPKQKDDSSVKEGRRLFYVAVTRARISLDIMFFSHPNGPTRYIREIPRKLWHSTEKINFPLLKIGEADITKKKTVQIEKAISVLSQKQWNIVTTLTNNLHSQFQTHHWFHQNLTHHNDSIHLFAIFLKTLVTREVFSHKISDSSVWFSAISDLGSNFKQKYVNSAEKYRDLSMPWTDITNDIWNISVLKQVFTDRRRKLLYHHPNPDDFLTHETWMNGVVEGIRMYHGDLLRTPLQHNLILQHEFYEKSQSNKIWDNIDIISDKSLILLKTSLDTSPDLKLEWIAQIITQKILCDIHEIPIDSLTIINLFNGHSWELKSESLGFLNRENWPSIFFAS